MYYQYVQQLKDFVKQANQIAFTPEWNHNATRKVHQELSKKIDQTTELLLAAAKDEKKLQHLLFELANDPLQFCKATIYTVSFGPFLECACTHARGFSRVLFDRRAQIEKKMIELCKSIKPTERSIRIISLGCGELLQDLIMLAKLLKNHIHQIDWVLIDPELKPNADTFFELIQAICKEAAGKITIKITGAYSVQDYIEEKNPAPDIIIAVDFLSTYNAAFNTVFQAKSLLTEQSKMLVTAYNHDLLFTEKNATFFNANPNFKFPVKQYLVPFSIRDLMELNIAILIVDKTLDYFYQYVAVLHAQTQLKKINLTMVEPQEKNISGNVISVDFPCRNMTKEKVAEYCAWFLQGITLSMKWIKGYNELGLRIAQVEGLQHMIIAHQDDQVETVNTLLF